jgi:hypothetical protein
MHIRMGADKLLVIYDLNAFSYNLEAIRNRDSCGHSTGEASSEQGASCRACGGMVNVTFVPAKGVGKFESSSAKSETTPKRLDFWPFREEKFKKTGTRILIGSQLSFIIH